MKSFTCLLLCLLGYAISAYATHLKGAELTAARSPSGALTHVFTLVIYEETNGITDIPGSLDIGNGESASLSLITEQLVSDRVSKKVYTATHSFPASGIYLVSYTGSNRNQSVNIPNAVEKKLYIELQLFISPALGENSLPVFSKQPRFFANAGEKFTDDYSATDPEGDSLVYKLVTPFNTLSYTYPSQVGGDTKSTFVIDSHTGVITWDTPMYVGNYVVIVQVEEWRRGIKTGVIYRDIQITVTGNGPVVINSPADERRFNIFPNPANQKVFFTLPQTNTQVVVEMWTIKGQLLHRQMLQLSDDKPGMLDLRYYPGGLYVVKLATANAFFTKKIIVVH